MSKGQRGNKEAKKPKKARPVVIPTLPSDKPPTLAGHAAGPVKRK